MSIVGDTAEVERVISANVTLTEAKIDDPVALINAFSVPVEEDELFLERWKDNARAMSDQPGFVRARMFRSLVDDAEIRFVNVAEWATGAALDAARENPEWRATIYRILDDPNLHVTARPVVYRAEIEVGPGDKL